MPSKRKSKNSRRLQRGDFHGGNHLAAHLDSADHATPQGLDSEPHPVSQNGHSTNQMNPRGRVSKPYPTSQNGHSTNRMNPLGLDSEPPSASQNGRRTPTGSPGNGSFQDGNASPDTNHSACSQDDHPVYHETRENCAREQHDPQQSPVSLSEDSGFTSSHGDGSFRDEIAISDSKHSGTSALRELGIELNLELSNTAAAFPKRPGFGSLGRKIKVITNCYPLTVPEGNVYHYDVEVLRLRRNREASAADGVEVKAEKYRCLKTKEKRRVIESMVRRDAIFNGTYPAYDGENNLFTRQPLSAAFPHVFTTDDEDEIHARVKIKPVKKGSTTSCAISFDAIHSYLHSQSDSVPLEAIAALETILRHGPCLLLTPIGRSFFSPPRPGCQNPIAGGLEIWYGYYQSVRISQWKPTVNLDISATTFYPEGPLLKYLARFLETTPDALRNTPFLSDRDRNRFNRKLKNRKIQTNHCHLQRKYTVIELVRENALNLRIDEDGLTVAGYFKQRYNIDLEYPNLPCLRVKPEERRVYFPVELCHLTPGQHYNDELTQAQKSEMIKFTSCAPKERFQTISNNMHFKDDRCVQEFGLEVSGDPLHVEGRILDPPSLIYLSDKKIRPREDAWNMRDVQFFQGADIKSWALLAFRSMHRVTLEKFGKLLQESGLKSGININQPTCIQFIDGRDIKTMLTRMKEEQKIELVVVVIPENNDAFYRKIKKLAETILGLNTQCILEKNVLRVTDPRGRGVAQLLSNLLLKTNAKMEGVNYSLVLSEIPSVLWKPVIIMGADVNHPGAYRGLRESLAACSGSLDARCSKYAVRTLPQKNVDVNKKSVEVILDLQSMVMDLLRAFYRHTRKQKPEKIIFYRDGVSEGEFLKVRDKEVTSIRKACRALDENYKPGITFIVVQKRHHVRFMTEDSELNVPPGTVIDRGVTHPKNNDFYLCSQKSFKGTAKPAHYTVLEDDNGFSADDLQKLTNQLCFCYVRCTKSISIPAPVAYADLAAYRARQYLDAEREGGSSANSSTGSLPPHRNPTATTDVIDCTTVVEEMRNRMYFV